MDSLAISVEKSPSPQEVSRLYREVDAFNVAATGDAVDNRIVAFLKDPSGTMHGGVIGDCWGGWIHIKALWVSQLLRGRGYGSQLLRVLETTAQEIGCRHAHLETFSFQAPQFYTRAGYQVFAELREYPKGCIYYFMKKTLGDQDR